jgi:hypothetical protein
LIIGLRNHEDSRVASSSSVVAPQQEPAVSNESSSVVTPYKRVVIPTEIEKARISLEKTLADKFEAMFLAGKIPHRYEGIDAIRVKVIPWNGFYLLSCRLGYQGQCGVYEAIIDGSNAKLYWINGVAAGHMDKQIQKSPNAGSKFSTASAFAATPREN